MFYLSFHLLTIESQVDNPVTLPYDGSTYDVTATVIATDVSSNSAVQLVTVSIRDVGGLDDNPDTGTGTNTDTRTEGSDTDTKIQIRILEQEQELELELEQEPVLAHHLVN